jgi:hypothetical protein
MKRLAMCLGVFFFGAAMGWGQEKEKKPEAPKPISTLAWLVGGVWTADASKTFPDIQRIVSAGRPPSCHANIAANR